MRIKNKYLRNRIFKQKSRKRAFKILGGEFTRKWYMPFWNYEFIERWAVDNQIKERQEYVEKWWIRTFVSGNKKGIHHAPKWYKTPRKRCNKRAIRREIDKMMQDINNVDDYEVPFFKNDADWDWF